MIFIDANSLGFAATAANNLRAGSVETGGVFGFLRSLRSIRQDFAGPIYILWDGQSWRHDVFPEYKANRKANSKLVAIKDSWKPQRKLLAKILTTLPVTQMSASNMEADDLAAKMTRKATEIGKSVVLVSGDKDWLQLVSDTVAWYDPIRDRRVQIGDFFTFTGYSTPEQFIQAKALTGDAGDNIPGVGGIGDVAAKYILDNYGTVGCMLRAARASRDDFNGLPKKYQDFIDRNDKQHIFYRNLGLVDLSHSAIPPMNDMKVIKGQYDEDRFVDFCGELAFNQIIRDLDSWIRPFLHYK